MTARAYGVESTAPIRICDNGGWTDTWVARHGKVFNLAVRPHLTVRIDTFPSGSRDAHVVLDVRNYATPVSSGPDWSIVGAAPAARSVPAARSRLRTDVDIEVTIRSDAPAGASTGTSAAAVVALIGALDRLSDGHRTPQEIARAAHAVETVRLGRQSGIQDQLCSAFGGANFIEITDYPRAIVSPLALSDRFAANCSGAWRSSILAGRTVRRRSTKGSCEIWSRRGPAARQLEALRGAAERARDALLAGDFAALGRAMRDNTSAQAELHGALVHRRRTARHRDCRGARRHRLEGERRRRRRWIALRCCPAQIARHNAPWCARCARTTRRMRRFRS